MPVRPALHDLFARSLAPLSLLLMGLYSMGFLCPAFGQTAQSAGAGAQMVNIQAHGPSTWDSYSGVISASDGNFYAVSADEEYSGFTPADFGCPDQSTNDCTFIDKITPSAMVTPLHTFETAGFGKNSGVPNTDGFGPTPLVEGPDGYLYGSANSGGFRRLSPTVMKPRTQRAATHNAIQHSSRIYSEVIL